MLKTLRVMLMTMSTLVATACQSTSEPDGPPAITGSIVARNVSVPGDGSPSIHVKETLATPCGIVFRMDLSTRVLRRAADGRITRASQSDLSVGQQVSVWAGAIAESCPGQGAAEVVEIIE
jgi:hypothetical protein